MHHGLLVAAEDVGQELGLRELGLEQRLPDAGHVAVAEDAEAAGEQLLLDAVALGVLGPEEADEGLGDGETDGLAHDWPARRGSTCWSAHVARIQAWSGWSVIFQARSPGPAMTLR